MEKKIDVYDNTFLVLLDLQGFLVKFENKFNRLTTQKLHILT